MAAGAGVDTGTVVRLAQYFSEPNEVARVVTELREINRKTGMQRALAIGEIVLQCFFGGSAAVWRERRKNKNNSVRRLADHPDCPFSRSALNEAIGVYVTVQTLPCVQTSSHISASHVAAVSGLDVDEQRGWLEQAEQRTWSVRQLKEKVRADRHQLGERRGRPRAAPPRRLIGGVRSAVAALDRAVRALSEVELGASDTRELTVLADEVALLQVDMRLHGSGAHTEPCVGPRTLAKAESTGDVRAPEEEQTRSVG